MLSKSIKALLKRLAVGSVALLLTVSTVSGAVVSADYIDTNRDTRPDPEKAEYITADLNGFEFLYETDSAGFFFKEKRDIIAIVDKRSGYTWKTGIDVPFSKELSKNISAAKTEEEIIAASEPKEKSLNTTYIGIANSLLTVEYSELEATKFISSASESGATSVISKVESDGSKWRLDAEFSSIDLKVAVYITFKDDTINYDIPFSEISGEGKKKLTALILTPFLGAGGGEAQFYDPETGEYGDTQSKYRVPGYVLVPDGSGALIRFSDNNVAFNQYIGDVYGSDPSTETYYYSEATASVPIKDPVMPVFGIAHGQGQTAFVAWANSGAEHMDIIVNPDETKKVKYTWAYPRFEYNMTYYQVYNSAGSGYFSLMDEPHEFDVSMTYRFLAGDGSTGYRADYVGMALAYREHLIADGTLKPMEASDGEIPIRIDFLMSDVKKSLIGTNQVVMTTVDDVKEILDELLGLGITNINSGLIGWQKKSETLAKPGSFSFTGKIGSKRDFKELIDDYAEKNIDISFSRDFVTINKKMVNYAINSAKHVNTWHLVFDVSTLYPENAPVTELGYALPTKTAEWIEKLSDKAEDMSGSLTITGAGNTLVSTYDRNGVVTSLTRSVEIMREAFEKASENMKLNVENPNMYVWEYTDRFLNAPVGTSQYVYETDSVPFLELVLHGTMEIYGPYSNFSFYTQNDILRMIDYNISPSFIFTMQPSYLLSDTASSDMYSTEYEQYKELAANVYGQVNRVLSEVSGWNWIGREVLESGVIANTYALNGETKTVIINYTDSEVKYFDFIVPAESAAVR
ncbi:MAG: hypothetical protein K6F63_01015 [Lachnospiraceae bacterium]|nr:hypothetical protein [Lachnospiraceae bacterium]